MQHSLKTFVAARLVDPLIGDDRSVHCGWIFLGEKIPSAGRGLIVSL
jgi:hypothetical protein